MVCNMLCIVQNVAHLSKHVKSLGYGIAISHRQHDQVSEQAIKYHGSQFFVNAAKAKKRASDSQ